MASSPSYAYVVYAGVSFPTRADCRRRVAATRSSFAEPFGRHASYRHIPVADGQIDPRLLHVGQMKAENVFLRIASFKSIHILTCKEIDVSMTGDVRRVQGDSFASEDESLAPGHSWAH